MKHLKKFNEDLDKQDVLDIKEIFQEYADKWNLSRNDDSYLPVLGDPKNIDTYQIYEDVDDITIYIIKGKNSDSHFSDTALGDYSADIYEFCGRLKKIGYSIIYSGPQYSFYNRENGFIINRIEVSQ